MSILQQLCSICGLMLANLLLVQASEVIKLPHYSLEYSYLIDDQAFALGAKGCLKAQDAPASRFEIVAFNSGVSFTEKLYLPLFQSIDLQRYFEKNDADVTIFTHEVNFKGSLSALSYWLFSKAFAKELPLVMRRLKRVAEAEEATENDE